MRHARAPLRCLVAALVGLDLASFAATHETLLSQPPILDEDEILAQGQFPMASDSNCNLDALCPASQSTALAAAGPGTDLLPLLMVFDEIVVWGLYTPAAPPAVDSFTVIVHEWGFPWIGPAVCSESGISGTRKVVGNVFDRDVYRHTLRLTASCQLLVPGNKEYWIEVFNDTGSDSDWFWMPGHPDWGWPIDCCDTFHEFGTVADPAAAPGADWIPLFGSGPLAIEARALIVGETQGLRLAKLPGDQILLEWDGDCGGGDAFSVYRGRLAAGYTSIAPETGLCDVSATSAAVEAGQGTADFFIVSPWDVSPGLTGQPPAQGSYGADSAGDPRPQPSAPCYELKFSLHDCAP